MSDRFAAALAAAFGAVAMPVAAHAQNALAAPSAVLPPVAVTAEAPSGSLTVPDVTEQRRMLEKTAGSVGFVDAESYRGGFANTLRDVLKDVPGVYVEERYGQELRLSVRGSGAARTFHLRGIELLQDGIPVNLADGSGDFYQIDPLGLRSAEVYKGGNGLAYGSSYLGGAINFVTPTAYTAVAPNLLRVEGGSFGTLRTSAQASRIVGNADFLISGTLTNVDGYRDHAKQESANVNANIGYRFGNGAETRFYFGNYFVDQRLPGTLTRRDALDNPKSATTIAGDQARVVRVQRLANRTSFVVGNGKLDIDSWAIHKDLFHPIFQVIDQDGWTYGLAPRWTGEFDLGGLRNELIVGARWFAGSNDARQYLNVGGSRGALTASAEQKSSNLDAYFENRLWVVPQVALMTGAKAFHSERRLTNAMDATRSGDKTYEGVAPKLGVLWQPRETIQVFADVTRSLDVPDFSDLAQVPVGGAPGFVGLAMQKAWTAEIGTRGSFGPYGWDVTAFHARVKGQLLQYTASAGYPATTYNADRTTLRGVEFGGSARLATDMLAAGDTLRLGGVWTWSDFRYDGDRTYGDNRIAGIPAHVVRGTLTYRHPTGISVAPSVDWVPRGADADQANTVRAPSYALVGLQLGWDLPNGISLFVDGRNLTDKRYVSDISTIQNAQAPGANSAIYYPGMGRSVYAGLRAAF